LDPESILILKEADVPNDQSPGAADSASGTPVPQLNVHALAVVPNTIAASIKGASSFAPAMAPAVPPGAAPAPLAPAKPGVERWPVKTGLDGDAGRVGTYQFAGINSEGIVPTSVEELIQLPRPADMADVRSMQSDYQDKRAVPVELVIWRIKADIIAIKKEADGDLHMVLQGTSGETMIGEAPTPRSPFVQSGSPWLDAMKEVRKKIADQFGASFAAASFQPLDAKYAMPTAPVAPAPARPAAPLAAPPDGTDIFDTLQPFKAKVEPTTATITGVGFFDRVHDQMGVAMKNGIELHPILAIQFQ
jgi:hypothetical protein